MFDERVSELVEVAANGASGLFGLSVTTSAGSVAAGALAFDAHDVRGELAERM